MDKAKRNKLMWRWSIVSAALIGAFWLVWYLTTGDMPVDSSVKMTRNWVMELPFGVPRWTDLFLGPLFSCAIIFVYFSTKNSDLCAGLGFGLVAGLAVVLGAELVAGLIFGLVAGLGIRLIFGLVAGLIWVLKTLFSTMRWRRISGWLAGK